LAGHILWAPDGDAAFDEGGHVVQFDVGNKSDFSAASTATKRQTVFRNYGLMEGISPGCLEHGVMPSSRIGNAP